MGGHVNTIITVLGVCGLHMGGHVNTIITVLGVCGLHMGRTTSTVLGCVVCIWGGHVNSFRGVWSAYASIHL